MHREHEILPRFAAQYTKLNALPRRTRRAMQRQWKQSLACMALLLVLSQAPAVAATINVASECSLVDAITAANTDTATGGCPKGSGADTIVLPANRTQTLTTVNNSDDVYGSTGANGLPVITSVMTINGSGAAIRRTGAAPSFRIFAVGDGANLTLKNTTVSGGRGGDGGAVFNAGNFTLTNSTLSGNSTSGDGAGGLENYGAATLTNSTISGNNTHYAGGGVNNSGTLTLTNSTVSGNYSSYYGGGVYNSGTLTVTNSTISGNSAGGSGGGMFNSRFYGALILTNSTISGNDAGFRGGGIEGAGEITLNRTLISGNSAEVGREVRVSYSGGEITADNFNVFGSNGDAGVDGFTPGAIDIVPSQGLNAILDTTLANNGGPTRTHALVSASPAVDAVDSGCPPPAKDQRGIARPQRARCDVGAFELQSGTAPPPDGRCAGNVTTIMGTELRDTLRGTNRADVIQGLGGNDTITGLNGSDTICGGTGNDRLNGGPGNDGLFADGGDDQLGGGDGNDRLNGGLGGDRCDGGDGGGDTATSCETRSNVP